MGALLRQGEEWGRQQAAIATRLFEEGGGSAAAAVVEAAADSSYSPWTSLACAELFIAGYAARLFTGGPGGKSAGDGTMAWLGLAPTSSAAHFWVIVCSCMLLFAAIRRFLQMYSWRRRYAEWLNPPPPKPPPQKPPPKPSSTPVRGGKTPAKTPSKPQKSWWEKCFGGGAPGASKDAKGRGGSSSIGGVQRAALSVTAAVPRRSDGQEQEHGLKHTSELVRSVRCGE